MLRLLLDEHLSPEIAAQLRAHNPHIFAISIPEWHEGGYLGTADERILEAAHDERLTLVTYDQRTILPLLRWWGEAGRSHGGVIMVSGKTLRANNLGGLVRALLILWGQRGHEDWTNQLLYLPDR